LATFCVRANALEAAKKDRERAVDLGVWDTRPRGKNPPKSWQLADHSKPADTLSKNTMKGTGEKGPEKRQEKRREGWAEKNHQRPKK
jgi:hypothetical protein